MKKTKIDWADSSWSPVTGCLHDCPYCYARGIARRFGSCADPEGAKEECRVLDSGHFLDLYVQCTRCDTRSNFFNHRENAVFMWNRAMGKQEETL